MSVADLKVGEEVTEFFLVKSKRNKTTRTQKPYLDLDLMDGSGQVNAKVWDNADHFSTLFKRGDVIKVKAMVEEFAGRRQLKVVKLRAVEEGEEVPWDDLIRSSPHDPREMVEYLKGLTGTVEDVHLKALLEAFFDDAEFMERFLTWAAARNIHHSYMGGLLEHTVKVVKTSVFAAEDLYPGEVDRDLLIAGSILHDIGKVRELSSGPEVGYTAEGYLLGHLTMAVEMVREKAGEVEGFPGELLTELLHILVSHHGEKEWGSPVVPMTPEALIVHGADNLDAKTQIALGSIADDPNEEEDFTEYHRTLGRHFYKALTRKGRARAVEDD